MSYTNIFGGSAVKPTQPSYLALALTADTALQWPLETTEGEPVVAAMINVTPSTSGLELAMPPGNTGSTGVQTMMTNVGSDTFTLTDTSGNTIVAIPTTQSWLIALTDNLTTDGTWTALQMASTTSSAVAASLAGDGLIALGNKLYPNSITNALSSNTSIVFADRLRINVWSGASNAIAQLDAKATLTAGWLSIFKNDAASPWTLTITTTGGETIDGGGPVVLQAGEGAIVVCGAAGFSSIRTVTPPIGIASGGTGATTAPNALINLGGTSLGIGLFEAPNAASARALLGLTNLNLTEATVSTDQALNSGSSLTAYVCTAALVATLPLTTSLSTSFIVAFFAQTGSLTLRPQATDKINNGVAGADYIMAVGGSVLLLTDANGNWWPFFLSGGNGIFATLDVTGAATITGNASLGGTLSVAGASTLTGAVTMGSSQRVVGTSTLSGNVTMGGAASIIGNQIIGGTASIVGAATVGGNATMVGTMSVGGAATIAGAATVTGALTGSTNATTGNQIPNLSQFPYTSGDPGTMTLPNGMIIKWGSTTMTAGSGSVTFATQFPSACDNVQLSYGGGTTTLSVNALAVGAKSATAFAIWGPAAVTALVYWYAIGH